MSVSWTISSGGIERTLAAWGISQASLVRRSYAADELSFSVKRADILAAPVFAEDVEIILKRAGIAYFIGTVTSRTSSFGAAFEQEDYVVQNAWHQMERMVYQQDRCVWDASFAIASSQLSSHVVLGMTTFGGRYVQTTAAMADVVNHALLFGVPITIGSVVGGIDFPMEELRDVTVAEALRRLGAYTPDGVMWTDYSAGIQTLNFGRRATLTAVSIDVLAAEKIVSCSIRARTDLVPKGVRFDIEGAEASPGGYLVTRIAQQSAGIPSGPGALLATITLPGAGTGNQAAAPLGLAAQYFTSLQTLQYEGALVLAAREVDGSIRPGAVINLTNGRPEWATMRAMVQTVTEDISAGTTTIEFGPPERLPAQDFVDQLMFARRVRLDTNLWSTRTCTRGGPDIDDNGPVDGTGGDEGDNPDKGKDPKDSSIPSVAVQVCEGGIQKTLVIKGQYAS